MACPNGLSEFLRSLLWAAVPYSMSQDGFWFRFSQGWGPEEQLGSTISGNLDVTSAPV